MRTLTTLLLAVALIVGASTSQAEMKIVGRAGAWSAAAGTASDNGKPMCRMTSTSDIRSVHVKWMVGDGLFVHLNKDSWNVPEGVEMPLAMRFDQEAPFRGTAKRSSNFSRMIVLRISDPADARRFMGQFETADRMRIAFPGGSEREWVMRMDGSDTIAHKFTECVTALKEKYGGDRATQPFGSPSTQPFGSQPNQEQQPMAQKHSKPGVLGILPGPAETAWPTTDQGTASGAAGFQRVLLYEEDPADPQGKRYAGSAIWRTETVTPEHDAAPDLAVRADLEIPDLRIKMTFSLRRNTDRALPASHIVEVVFSLPTDFPFGGIQNVPGILMKQAEQTRGAPLAGLAVKVTSGFFMVGLSSAKADMQRNIQMLKERPWFHIPIVYNNGRRAILAVEKGTSGEHAFEEAFKAWEQTSADVQNKPFQDRIDDARSEHVMPREEPPISLPVPPRPTAAAPPTAFAPPTAAANPTPLVAPPTAPNPSTNEPKRVRTMTVRRDSVSASDPTPSPTAQVAARKEEIFAISRPHAVVRLVVSVNGVPGNFLLDTGATFVSLKKSFAKRAKVEIEGENTVRLNTANGVTEVKRGRAATIQVRSLQANNVPIVVQDDAKGAYGVGIDGLLGMSFLGRFNLTLDARAVKIAPRIEH